MTTTGTMTQVPSTFKWKISHFLSRPERYKEYIYSPRFSMTDVHQRTSLCALMCYPKGEKDNGFMSLYIRNMGLEPLIISYANVKK